MATIEMKAKILQKNFEQIIYQFQTVAAETIKDTDKLTPKELSAIVFVGKCDGCIMREISNFLNVADSTVTMLVDNLVKRKLVERERSDEDRRIIKIVLTNEGKLIYKDHLKSYQKLCRGMLLTLDENEQDMYVNLMSKIADGAMEKFADN